ncbi:MAG: OmpA family protein [Bacteroidota bacterium]
MKRLYLLCAFCFSMLAAQAQEAAQFAIDTVYFRFDNADLPDLSKATLDTLIGRFSGYPSYYVEIFGHTDSIGSDKYNLQLSELRARAVSLYMVENGVDLNRIKYEGLGTNKPVLANDTYAGRRMNRRADVAVVFSNEIYEPPVEEDTTAVVAQEPEPEDPSTYTDTIYCDYNPFPVKNARRTVIITPEKTMVIIPRNAFKTEEAEVEITMKELFRRSDMITNSMPSVNTRSGPLEIAGSFSINATAKRRPVRMNEGVMMEAYVPTTRNDADMGAYLGAGGGRGGRRKPRGGDAALGNGDPGFNAVKSWNGLQNSPVTYSGKFKSYQFNIPGAGRYAAARPLYYSQNTDRNDNGVDILVKLKGRRYVRTTEVMIVGEVVKTYIPMKRRDTRNYEAKKVKFLDAKTKLIMIAIQYDDNGEPWLAKRSFTVESLAKKPKRNTSKALPTVKMKVKFRRLTKERLNELLTDLNV